MIENTWKFRDFIGIAIIAKFIAAISFLFTEIDYFKVVCAVL